MDQEALDAMVESLRSAGVDEEDLKEFADLESDLFDDQYDAKEAVLYSWALFLSLDARLKKVEAALRATDRSA